MGGHRVLDLGAGTSPGPGSHLSSLICKPEGGERASSTHRVRVGHPVVTSGTNQKSLYVIGSTEKAGFLQIYHKQTQVG